MNVLMMTNTYTPIVGGLERSVQGFTKELRDRGHRVIVVAPRFKGSPAREEDVIRVPAIQNFNGSDFSVRLPIPGRLSKALGDFKPDVVHSHHPYLIGDAALRVAYAKKVPLVFTHHTLYEHNTHYVPGDSEALKRFVVKLSTGYANLSDCVLAPSASVAALLASRGVETPIEVLPTGIYPEQWSSEKGPAFRRETGIPANAFVIGTVGRLAPEKNLDFLMSAVARFMMSESRARFLVVGDGPLKRDIELFFEQRGLRSRLHLTGVLKGRRLVDAYHAMDAFVFASQSETQGVVLTEAMAAGVPVIAVDAFGVRDIVRDRKNGRLLPRQSDPSFVSALGWLFEMPAMRRREISRQARDTARSMAMPACAERLIAIYSGLRERKGRPHAAKGSMWATTRSLIRAEWDLMKNLTKATTAVIQRSERNGLSDGG